MTRRAVRTLFLSERAQFARRFPRVAKVKLRIVAKHYLSRPNPRDFAWYDPETHDISITARLLTQDPDIIHGILRHELGHAADAHVDLPEAEARADLLALRATGEPIRYQNDLQHVRKGRVGRPRYLTR